MLTVPFPGSFVEPNSEHSGTPTKSHAPRTKPVIFPIPCALLAYLVTFLPYRSILDNMSSVFSRAFHILPVKGTYVVDCRPHAMYRLLSILSAVELGANNQ